MPRGALPEYRRRKEPVLDDHLRASVERANGTPDPETGKYATLIYAGCESRERAKEIVRALYRSARYVKVSVATVIHPANDGTFNVEFTAINKAHARKYVLEKYGTDRSKWAYDPRARNPKADANG